MESSIITSRIEGLAYGYNQLANRLRDLGGQAENGLQNSQELVEMFAKLECLLKATNLPADEMLNQILGGYIRLCNETLTKAVSDFDALSTSSSWNPLRIVIRLLFYSRDREIHDILSPLRDRRQELDFLISVLEL